MKYADVRAEDGAVLVLATSQGSFHRALELLISTDVHVLEVNFGTRGPHTPHTDLLSSSYVWWARVEERGSPPSRVASTVRSFLVKDGFRVIGDGVIGDGAS